MSTVFRLVRDNMDTKPTTGQLFAPPDLSLFTLEDPWLDNARDISCIPVGVYRCLMTMSRRWQKMMPEILNVPNRDHIRIHGGNTTDDTEGCILLGMEILSGGFLGHSQYALGCFIPWLEDALKDGSVFCEVSNASS